MASYPQLARQLPDIVDNLVNYVELDGHHTTDPSGSGVEYETERTVAPRECWGICQENGVGQGFWGSDTVDDVYAAVKAFANEHKTAITIVVVVTGAGVCVLVAESCLPIVTVGLRALIARVAAERGASILVGCVGGGSSGISSVGGAAKGCAVGGLTGGAGGQITGFGSGVKIGALSSLAGSLAVKASGTKVSTCQMISATVAGGIGGAAGGWLRSASVQVYGKGSRGLDAITDFQAAFVTALLDPFGLKC